MNEQEYFDELGASDGVMSELSALLYALLFKQEKEKCTAEHKTKTKGLLLRI